MYSDRSATERWKCQVPGCQRPTDWARIAPPFKSRARIQQSSANRAPDDLPVVLTVPDSSRQNFVVAENFAEFLGLGAIAGWAGLAELAYEPQDAVRYLSDPDDNDSETESLLEALRSELQ